MRQHQEATFSRLFLATECECYRHGLTLAVGRSVASRATPAIEDHLSMRTDPVEV